MTRGGHRGRQRIKRRVNTVMHKSHRPEYGGDLSPDIYRYRPTPEAKNTLPIRNIQRLRNPLPNDWRFTETNGETESAKRQSAPATEQKA